MGIAIVVALLQVYAVTCVRTHKEHAFEFLKHHTLQRNFILNYTNSETPLLWTPWGRSKVSFIERCPHFRGKFILRQHNIWDIVKCPYYSLHVFQGCPLS